MCLPHQCCTLGIVGSNRDRHKAVLVDPERGISLSGNKEDKQQDTRAQKSGWNKLWPILAGGVGGAVIVGAVWGIVAQGHQNDPLVATVGSNQIHQSNFQDTMESMAGQQTLQQMITNQLIKDGAKAQKITASKQDMDNALQNLESQYGISNSTQLAQFLQANGVTQAQLNDILQVNILEQKLSEQGVTVSDKEIQDYYDQNKAAFTPQGSKTPQPLSAVKSQIVDQIKQSKAIPADQLLANLAKKDSIKIYDTKYSSIKTQLENPTSGGASGTGAPTGTGTTNSAGQ